MEGKTMLETCPTWFQNLSQGNSDLGNVLLVDGETDEWDR